MNSQESIRMDSGIAFNTFCEGDRRRTIVADGDACYSTIIEIGPYHGQFHDEIIAHLTKIFSVPQSYPCKKCTLLNKYIFDC